MKLLAQYAQTGLKLRRHNCTKSQHLYLPEKVVTWV